MIWSIAIACAGPAVTETESAQVELTLQAVTADQLRSELTRTSDGPRVYNFWATWCGPCVAEMPEIRAFAEAHPEVDVTFVNSDWPSESVRKSAVLPFIVRHHLTAVKHVQVQAEDPSKALALAVDGWPNRIPVTMIVRADGKTSRLFAQSVLRADLEEALELSR
jgi:thiol-disulfide isomerase/thioredoxin